MFAFAGIPNLATKLDALSITTSLAYDGLNRVTGKTYSNSPTGVSYAYDSTVSNCNGLGRLSSVTYGTSVANDSCYDVMGRVTKSSQTTGATTYGPIAYAYDLSGALASEQYPSGRTLTNAFDAAGRIIGLRGLFNSNPTAYASNIGYAAQGPLQSVLLGNGVTENWLFATPQLQPTQLQAGSALTLTWGYGSNSTNNGNILSATIANSGGASASQAFGYDRVNRLTAASEGVNPSTTGTWTRNYAYDEWGNGWVSLNTTLPLDPTTPLGTLGSANFDANNRLNVDSAAYNAVGNQTAIAGFTNTFDAENRLLTSTLGGVTTTYTYDGDGRRVQKATGGSTTTYVYDAAGQLAAEYSTAPPAPPCTTCYLTEDHLGSTRMMTDGTTGKPVAFHDYVPFGEEIQAGVGSRSSTYYPPGPLAINDTVAQKFTGKERDVETGLDYFGARYFASAQGRWTSPDWSTIPMPVPFANLADPQTLNLYAYVRDNPLSVADADGHGEKCSDNPGLCASIRDAVSNGGSLEEGKTAWQKAEQTGKKVLTAVGNGISKTSDLLNTAPVIGVVMGLAMFAETGGQEETPALAEAAESLAATAEEGEVTLTRFGEASEHTVERLTTEAAKAETKAQVDFTHGVSTMANSVKAGGKALMSAVQEYFEVKKTGSNPNHYTVVLPKPVTQQVVDLFKKVFWGK
ncbi:MAG: RHS repeat domain-containing protein [Polyangia bacterium]